MTGANDAGGCGCACGGAGESLYLTTQAIQRELGDFSWAAYRLGDDLQRALIDAAFDVAALSVDRIVARTSEWAAQAQASASLLASRDGVDVVVQQARNNFEVYNLVKNVRSLLPMLPGGPIDLTGLATQAYGLGAYADLWAIEGLGHDYTQLRLDSGVREGVMREGPAASLPASSLTMMHAGLGLALAERILPELTPCAAPRQFERCLSAFLHACRNNSRNGYVGAAYESLGLVARTWHPQLVNGIDETLRRFDGLVAAHFWHGAGRALYFLPLYIVPVLSPWRAADADAPDGLAHDNLYAGLAWASTLVNMRQPRVLAALLRREGERLQQSAAVANGIASALVVASDVTPNDPYVTAFAEYRPEPGTPDAEVWNTVVGPAARAALTRYGPALREQGALDVVFRYGDLDHVLSHWTSAPLPL